MCFTPQRCALFRQSSRHRIVKKWSEHVVLLTFSLPIVLRTSAACTFSTSQLPKVLRQVTMLYTFDFQNALRATVACIFSTSQLPRVWSGRDSFYHFSLQNVLRPQWVHFFNEIWPAGSASAALASLLFESPCGAPGGSDTLK